MSFKDDNYSRILIWPVGIVKGFLTVRKKRFARNTAKEQYQDVQGSKLFW